jgi:hypothetical protein
VVIENTELAAGTSAMIYVGPTIPGGENVTLSGTAEVSHCLYDCWW